MKKGDKYIGVFKSHLDDNIIVEIKKVYKTKIRYRYMKPKFHIEFDKKNNEKEVQQSEFLKPISIFNQIFRKYEE